MRSRPRDGACKTGELRRLRFGGYRVLYLVEEMTDRVALIQLSRNAPDAR